MTDFLDLQNGWYNGFLQGMGQSASSFQIIQPAPPLVSGDKANSALWTYFNNIPPASLTQNYIASGGNQFYSDYWGLMSALTATRTSTFKTDIGDQNYQAWQTYLHGLTFLPSPNQLPTIFRSWAMINAPDVAVKGASDLAAMNLDPVLSTQMILQGPYTDLQGNPKPFDWSLGYNDLVNQLNSSPNRSFTFDSSTMNCDVKTSWTQGGNSGFFGLWGGSSSSSSLSQTFAASTVTMRASFEHVFTFIASPGNWYNSSAMALAFDNKSGNPWSPGSSINWNNTFGQNGNMQRFMANLIVASGMQVTVTSSATYSSEQQTEIHNSSHAGFWPFYSSGGGSSSTNTVTFDQSGTMTVQTSSQSGIPIVLGGNVLSVGEFLGHSIETAGMFVRMAAAAELESRPAVAKR